MKPFTCILLLLLLFLNGASSLASEEDHVPWQSVVIEAEATPETGAVRVTATADKDELTSLRIHAFDREESLGKADLAKLHGYPLASIAITREPGYENIGGYTVHVRLKRTRYDDSKKPKTEVMIVSLPKKGAIQVMQMPDGNPE
ncbi:hypothetical protein [Roseimicrobium sp. ORNL1]|uniref:hypothetical protein n=1 Tax=Roseimicrobium sp. ORNL1 TaxID=2711231 RepID=UPI0013E10975|nr:hypothetical protein [Roseimicrobium sp. ORNL1]QIF00476.1 hypothetical protein G5S37_02710 [Roseimicrobium sp. ORNL1]